METLQENENSSGDGLEVWQRLLEQRVGTAGACRCPKRSVGRTDGFGQSRVCGRLLVRYRYGAEHQTKHVMGLLELDSRPKRVKLWVVEDKESHD